MTNDEYQKKVAIYRVANAILKVKKKDMIDNDTLSLPQQLLVATQKL